MFRSVTTRLVSWIISISLFCGAAFAQSNSAPDQQTIQVLLQQINELKQRVAALESRGDPVSAPLSAQAASVIPTPPEDQPSSTPLDLRAFRGIKWRGFGEFNYKVLDQRRPELGTFGFVPGSAANFYVGDFDLLLTSNITDKASVLSEVVLGEEDAQSFSVDLERVLFKYEYNDHLNLSFGRYHTGVGYYNTAFHSGKWLQTTADRPTIMEFADDGGLLPTQAVGISATGAIPSGQLGLNYTAEYGSSDTIRPNLDGVGEVDENNGNHINVGAFIRPDSIPGLQVGGSFYHDKISDFERGPSVRLGQSIANLHVVYTRRGIEFLNEGFLIRNAYEQNGPVYNMPAFYSQFSKQYRRIRPFVRYQYVNANPDSIYHDDVLLRHGPSFGARYDLNDSIAFKTQLDHTFRTGKPDLNGLQLQLAFAF